MAKNTFSDIVPPERRSIRDVHRSRVTVPKENVDIGVQDEVPFSPPPTRPPKRIPYLRNQFFSRYGLWIVATAVLAILVIAVSLIFSGSKVVVTPKQKDVNVNGEFTAVREPITGQLAYDVVKIKRTAGKSVTSNGIENVEEKASGSILVFNDFSTKSQRLVTNTRFETPKGLVYRIHKAVIIPGQKKGSDGRLIPGSVEVKVYADESGEKYNIDLTDFTIPGFKGTPQYKGFYARSKTSMTGGFSGEKTVVDSDTLQKVTNDLEDILKQQLADEARSAKPNDFVLLKGAVFFVYDKPVITDDGKDKARVDLTGKAYAVIFKDTDLAQHIVAETVADYNNELVMLESTDNLSFKLAKDATFDPTANEPIIFDLKGSARAVWVFDEKKLAKDLSGRSKDALPTILSGYPGIKEAEVILRPFWKQTFPNDPNKISIRINKGGN